MRTIAVIALLVAASSPAMSAKYAVKSGTINRGSKVVGDIKASVKNASRSRQVTATARAARDRLLKAGLRALATPKLRKLLGYSGVIKIAEKKVRNNQGDKIVEYTSALILTRHGLAKTYKKRGLKPVVTALKSDGTAEVKMAYDTNGSESRLTPVRTSQKQVYQKQDSARGYDATTYADGTSYNVAGSSNYITRNGDLNSIANGVGLNTIGQVTRALQKANAQVKEIAKQQRKEMRSLGVNASMISKD